MRLADILILLSLAAIWGASFLFMRVSTPDFGPVPLVAFRMTIAGTRDDGVPEEAEHE